MSHRRASLALALVTVATLLIGGAPPSNAASEAVASAPDRVRWRIQLDGDS